MTLSDFNTWLTKFLNFEKTQTKGIFWLDSMKFLAEKLGNPQNDIPCIHVAGSKGKGSVSAMIANIVEASGKKCGLYSSPHIVDFRERIKSASSFFEDSVYEKAADILVSCVESIPKEELPGGRALTWFELVTVYSFLCFKYAAVDFAVYETGLGGRLDSTNIVNPLLTVLMPIEKEHTEFLGNTIKEIAAEKAGIIKPGKPAVVSFQNYLDAEEVFKNVSQKCGSECIFVRDCVKILNHSYSESGLLNAGLDFFGNSGITESFAFTLRLPGAVQVQNAAAAITAVKKALPEISNEMIQEGLSKTFIPARFEISSFAGRVCIFDGAHTVKSISNTVETLKEIFPKNECSLIFACAGDKDIEDIIPLFKGVFARIVFTSPKTVRSCNSQKAYEIAERNGIKAEIIDDIKTAFQSVISGQKKSDILLVTGSFYLAAEAKELVPELEKEI